MIVKCIACIYKYTYICNNSEIENSVGGKTKQKQSSLLLFLSLMDFDLNTSHRNFTRVLNPTKEQSL